MASNTLDTNGESTTQTCLGDIKIMVVGEKKCGKSQFIKAFHGRENTPGGIGTDDCARAYSCRYLIDNEERHVKIYEIVCGPDNLLPYLVEKHGDANSIAFVFAVDDPPSFRAIEDKWLKVIEDIPGFTKQAFLIGTKNDLRSDPQVIERLARDGQAPVTEEDAKSLVEKPNILQGYYDCSAFQTNNGPILVAFHSLVQSGLLHLNNQPQNP